MATAVRIENAVRWICASDGSAAHVGVGGDAHSLSEHDRVAGFADHAADSFDQLVVRRSVVRRPVDHDLVAVDDDPVVQSGQVLGGEIDVQAAIGDHLQRPQWRPGARRFDHRRP